MIPRPHITSWSNVVGWPTQDQVEQDLVLSRLIVEIASDDYLGKELVFRGGTCLHKLHVKPGLRYSEDLDYVRASEGGIKQLTVALGNIGERVGMDVNTRINIFPKIYLRAPLESGNGMMRIKIEINTHERLPAQPLAHVPFAVESSWFTGLAAVQTFSLPELFATKLRALYQRSKGRDLFDLWLGLERLGVEPEHIAKCFSPYQPASYSRELAAQNLRAKLGNANFREDLSRLVAVWPPDYDLDSAAELLLRRLFTRI